MNNIFSNLKLNLKFKKTFINLLNKIPNKQIISFLFFGVLTTFVNIGTSFILKAFFKIEGNIASTIGIILSIIFAYFTNRKWVFISNAHTLKSRIIEFFKFVLGRSFTMIIEIIGVYFLNDVIHSFYNLFKNNNVPYLINKIIITFIVVILNFFISKFFTFKSNNKNKENNKEEKNKIKNKKK